ncbi:MAG: ribonuclease H-like domain-containing protein [Myxococcota bacterium]
MLEALAERHARRAAAERAENERRGRQLPAHDVLATARDGASRATEAWRQTAPAEGLRVLTYELEPDHHHGRISVADGLVADTRALAELALDPSLEDLDLSRALFLDTETTGLSMGGGTVAFLVGLAFFVDGALVVEQLFLEELSAEPMLLQRLKARVAKASVIITYNGKSYDWPLLTSRYVLNRVEPPPSRPHLDLLTLARRVYRARLGSVRLVQMEMEVLGHHREHDISGAEIPGTYWAFQRHGRPEGVLPVLEHNIQDLVALSALQGELARRYRDLQLADDPADQWSRARVAFRARSYERALSFAQAAIDGGATSPVVGRAAMLAADVHRKSKRYEAAVDVLESSLCDLHPNSLEMSQVKLELAKLWEHRLKDPSRALRYAAATEKAEGLELSKKRQARLKKRMARKSPAGGLSTVARCTHLQKPLAEGCEHA